MCIYYGKDEKLTYESREHIFPATLGGVKKLSLGCVSDQANKYFSKLESDLITNSYLGLPKSFSGPGKRGNDNKPGRLTISLMTDETTKEETLGFIFNGTPSLLPQIIISNNVNEVQFAHDANIQTEKDLNKLIEHINNFDNKYTLIEQKPSNAKFIIGLHENRLYISTTNQDKIDLFIKYITNDVIPKMDYSKAQAGNVMQPKVLINMQIQNENNSRVYAKTAINVLADLKGRKYLQNKKLSKFIKWIVGGKDYKFTQIPRPDSILKPFLAYINDDHYHYCMLVNVEKRFAAFVSFYGFCMGFNICNAFDGFFDTPYILFCDWKNHKEFSIDEL